MAVVPSAPTACRGLFTASSKWGRTMASTFFIPPPYTRFSSGSGRRGPPAARPRSPHDLRGKLPPRGVGHVGHVAGEGLRGRDLGEHDLEPELGQGVRDRLGA